MKERKKKLRKNYPIIEDSREFKPEILELIDFDNLNAQRSMKFFLTILMKT